MGKLSVILTTVLILSMVGLGLWTFAVELTSRYSYAGNIPEEYRATMTNLSKTLGNTTSLGTDISTRVQQSEGFTVRDGATILDGSVVSLIKLPFQTISFISSLISTASGSVGLPIPNWFINGIIAVITITISFIIISALLKTEI